MHIEQKLSELLLPRLHSVQKSQNGYMAFCPAHNDKRTRSLGIKLGDNGGIIINCLASCSVNDILASIGLSMTDLFPDRDWKQTHLCKPTKRPRFSRYEMFDTLAFEAFVIHTYCKLLINGSQLTKPQLARLERAMDVVGACSDEVNQ